MSEITEYKEHATRESFKEFFKKRMDNRQAYKGKSYRYDIVHEDSLFIYYGILCITEQGREYVSHLYKTNRTHVKSLFPAYQSIEGYHIRRKAETYIPEIIWIEGGASYAYANIDISLDADTIKVVYDKYEKKDFLFKKSNHHLICFDKHDLTLLRIKELDKPQSTSGKKK
ncbi:MAG: hypothetical protein R2800_15300 [Flavipsychrobacter sp.]